MALEISQCKFIIIIDFYKNVPYIYSPIVVSLK